MCMIAGAMNTCITIGETVKPVLGGPPLQPSESGHSRQVVAYNRLHTKSCRHNYECVHVCVYNLHR